MDVHFTYGGKKYVAPQQFVDTNRVVLPCGTVIQAHGWDGIHPGRPRELSETRLPFDRSLPVATIAQQAKAAIAIAVAV
jgi:hypothetical protein